MEDKIIKLGLDLSTSTVGWAVVNEKDEILDKGYISTKKDDSFNDKVLFIINILSQIINKWTPSQVNIENSLLQFAANKSRAKILIMLAKLNGIVTFYISKLLKINTININASTARKVVLGKSRDKNFDNVKEYVLIQLINKYGEEFLDTLPKMKTKDKLAKESFDVCDAIIMALYNEK